MNASKYCCCATDSQCLERSGIATKKNYVHVYINYTVYKFSNYLHSCVMNIPGIFPAYNKHLYSVSCFTCFLH